MRLNRGSFRIDGVFGILFMDDGSPIAHTLEHSFIVGDGEFHPVIPPGEFLCVRGMHRLDNMTEDFETFEVTGIEGHRGLLFHWGNYNKDSSGCVLLGSGTSEDGIGKMITNSRNKFGEFMKMMEGVNSFQLVVSDTVV